LYYAANLSAIVPVFFTQAELLKIMQKVGATCGERMEGDNFQKNQYSG